MAMSKRLRFEILRRDNHRCRYCGATEVRLVIDHVVPTTLGGSDDPDNLVASCEPCNSGKSSTTPDAPTVAQVSDDALRWARAMQTAANAMLAEHDAREAELAEFLATWDAGRSFARLDDDWEASVQRFRAAGLPMALLLDAVRKAHANRNVTGGNVFRYMCGIAWSRITELQEAARAIVSPAPAADERDQVADRLYAAVVAAFPDLKDDIHTGTAEDLSLVGDERMVPGEESPYVVSAHVAVQLLIDHLVYYQMVVKQAYRRLPPEHQARIQDRLDRDLLCAGEEGTTDLQRWRQTLRHMFTLAEQGELG